MRHTLRSAGLTLALMLPAGAWAAPGYVTGNVNLRAGPEVDYPAVLTIPAGSTVDIQGCLEDYGWCDVIAGGNRGWVAGNYIQYEYEQRRVFVPDYGPRIGIPIITFAIGSYWDSYYRGRPFYSQRDRWYGRPPVHRPPPPRPPSWNHGPGRPGWNGPTPRPPGHGGNVGRPPQWGGPGAGRPPQGGNNGPGRPPQPGNAGPGRPPQGGNAGPGRPPQGGGNDRGRPPQAGGARPGGNDHGGSRPSRGGNEGDRRDGGGR